MRWSFTVGRVGDTLIRIHVTLLLLLAWYAWGGWRMAGAGGAVQELAFIAMVFGSVLLHEFGHIRAARHYGIPTPEVLLTPIGGLARIARMPDSPRQEVVIAIAGPLVTLAIVLVVGAGVLVVSGQQALIPESVVDVPLWTAVVWVNLFLLAFNLLPSFPMDGGRVLRALLAMRLGMVRGTRIAARVGQAFAVVFAIVGLQYNVFLLLIAAFVFLGAEAEYDAVQTRAVAGDLTAQRLTVTDVRVLQPTTRLAEAIRLLTRSDQRAFPVLDDGGHLLGILTRDEMLTGVANAGLEAPVTVAMAPPALTGTIAIGLGFEEAVQALWQSKRDALPVVDAEGRFAGLMTRDNVTDVLLVQRLRQRLDGGVAG
jgi:stage IV sporulation protein FB